MTTLALVLLLIVVVGLAVATTVGYVRGGLPVATPDVPPPLDAPVAEAADLDRARFGLALRGYRMDQVDEVLDGARDALVERDAEIARLRGQLAWGDAAPVDAGTRGDVPEVAPVIDPPSPSAQLKPADVEPPATQPHTAQPHTVEPHTAQPHTVEPHTAQPHTVEPHTAQPHTVEPVAAQPSAGQPSVVQPHTVEPQPAGGRE